MLPDKAGRIHDGADINSETERREVLAGAASSRITEYRQNWGDFRGERKIQNLLAWAISKGIPVPKYCRVIPFPAEEELLHRGQPVRAKYFSAHGLAADARIYWYDAGNQDASIWSDEHQAVVINIDPRIMENDEEFLHVLGHEVTQIRFVKEHLDSNGSSVSVATFYSYVQPSHDLKNNLHWLAWDFADNLVEARRREYDAAND